MRINKFSIGLVLFFLLSLTVYSQDPLRFSNEIEDIGKRYSSKQGSRGLIVFTGSSSIRKWDSIPHFFPGKNIINTGFGGSQMSDLIYYAEQAIIRYKPVQVFIYEGDNDLAGKETPTAILKEADSLIRLIHKSLPKTEIVIISAKPSPLRWGLKDEYLMLNKGYSKLQDKYKYVKYIDLWTPLLGPTGRPAGVYYVSDSLHINRLGYVRWAAAVGKILR